MTIPEFLALTNQQRIDHIATLTPAQVAERFLRVRDNELAVAALMVALADKAKTP